MTTNHVRNTSHFARGEATAAKIELRERMGSLDSVAEAPNDVTRTGACQCSGQRSSSTSFAFGNSASAAPGEFNVSLYAASGAW